MQNRFRSASIDAVAILFLLCGNGCASDSLAVRPSYGDGVNVESKDTTTSLGDFEGSSAQIGKATYYARKFRGQRTASGESLNLHELTAAHRTLPFGTMVRVTNMSNKKSVVVRINDRGPAARNRIIDMTTAAARKIDLIAAGVATVKLEVVK